MSQQSVSLMNTDHVVSQSDTDLVNWLQNLQIDETSIDRVSFIKNKKNSI